MFYETGVGYMFSPVTAIYLILDENFFSLIKINNICQYKAVI